MKALLTYGKVDYDIVFDHQEENKEDGTPEWLTITKIFHKGDELTDILDSKITDMQDSLWIMWKKAKESKMEDAMCIFYND